ncbi:MAG: hypothetical protein P8013_00680 [Candidatus Sulfobium sp.]
MKVFFIFAESEIRDRNIYSLVSAFADVECIGQGGDMLDAIESIQSRYPKAAISDAGALRQRSELLDTLFDGEGAVVILSERYRVKERSVYFGVDFSLVDPMSYGWVVQSIRRVIEECHGKTAE